MRVVIFCHSLISDWNHGNAHFLRGVATELIARGHDVRVYEDRDAWSIRNLVALHAESAVERFHAFYPQLESFRYDATTLDLNRVLADADLVLVHEWNPPELVANIGRHRACDGDYVLFFHDTHHRALTAPNEISQLDLSHYDGVLAFGNAVASAYLKNGWARNVWTWHEAADTRVFWGDRPHSENGYDGELVWIGNWGDEERTEELREFLLRPVKELGLKTRAYGVRYPEWALKELAAANIEYGGWLPNFEVPRVFSRFRVTIHVPRRPYVQALPGIPTIRVFEALACGIPLVSAFWPDEERLFSPGHDYLVARDGREMVQHLRYVLRNVALARDLASHGQRTIFARHTCSHRVDELLAIYARCSRIPRRAVA
jgi:spore maturation protein CgeB